MNDVAFVYPVSYDKGLVPRVAIYSAASSVAGSAPVVQTTVVEVHKSEEYSTLYYHVGSLQHGVCSFGSSHEYGRGVDPAVAMNDSVVVAIHEGSDWSTSMEYVLGEVDASAQTVSFGDSVAYNSGRFVGVAINTHNVVVEVHQGSFESDELWYHIGKVAADKQSIGFGTSISFGSGTRPAVALNDNGLVVVVYADDDQLYYRLGTVSADATSISFQAAQAYDQGAHPAVALTYDGTVVEVHQSQSDKTLWRRTGQADRSTGLITWPAPSIEFAAGVTPSVAVAGSAAITVSAVQYEDSHKMGSAPYYLQYATSLYQDRANWMYDNLLLLGKHALQDLVLPGSHDAGTAVLADCSGAIGVGSNSNNTRTQTLTIGQQLAAGSRYIDIRPTIYNGTLYTAHAYDLKGSILGCNGPSLTDLFAQVMAFMKNSSDLVILKFSHYCNRDTNTDSFTTAEMRTLAQAVLTGLGSALYTQPAPAQGLSTAPLSTFIGTAPAGSFGPPPGCVLAVFDGLAAIRAALPATAAGSTPDVLLTAGLYSYCDQGSGTADLVVYDQYSDQDTLDAMISDQQAKLQTAANHGNNLFLLSWTLSQAWWESALGSVYLADSILTLADEADQALPSYMRDWQSSGIIANTPAPDGTARHTVPNILYIDNYRGFAADIALQLNQQLLK